MNRLIVEIGVLERDIERRRASGLPVGEPTQQMALVQGKFDKMIATRNAAVANFGKDDGGGLSDYLESAGRSVQRTLHEVGFVLLYMIASVVGVLLLLAVIFWLL